MYGKLFASTFTGSMVGAGTDVFAVWGYVIANARDGQVELNPRLLATTLGCPEDRVAVAIRYLCAPDEHSRSPAEGGCRMVQEGPFLFRVVNHMAYKMIRNDDDRRAYNREKQRESRARRGAVSAGGPDMSATVNDSQQMSTLSAQSEAEAEEEAEAGIPPVVPPSPVKASAAPPAREKRSRPRTRLPAEGTWTEDQASRLLAVGRSPLQEEQAFRAHHEAKGSLMASWTAARTTWVLGAEKGYGAPKQSNHARPTADDNVRRQFERVRQLEAAERGRALP